MQESERVQIEYNGGLLMRLSVMRVRVVEFIVGRDEQELLVRAN